MVMMKKITMALMMFALMALLVACGANTMKSDDKTTGEKTEPKTEES